MQLSEFDFVVKSFAFFHISRIDTTYSFILSEILQKATREKDSG